MNCLEDFEKFTLENAARSNVNFWTTGGGEGYTKVDNRRAFSRFRIRPRLLQKDVLSKPADIRTTILGRNIDMPICISPMGLTGTAHPSGGIGIARAAQDLGTISTVGIFSSEKLEDVVANVPRGHHWIQMYFFERDFIREYIRRAERSGYRTLVLTVDSMNVGHGKGGAKRLGFLDKEQTLGVRMRNFEEGGAENKIVRAKKPLVWSDVKWIKSITSLPVVIKGIITGEDAIEAVRHGADAIFVSNHGGRILDGVPATIDVLSEVIDAVRSVGSDCEVYLDSGVRTGTDVFKALALGARAVFIGQPVLWGLVYDGENGVRRILELLRDELRQVMALAGCAELSDIQRSMVIHETKLWARL